MTTEAMTLPRMRTHLAGLYHLPRQAWSTPVYVIVGFYSITYTSRASFPQTFTKIKIPQSKNLGYKMFHLSRFKILSANMNT